MERKCNLISNWKEDATLDEATGVWTNKFLNCLRGFVGEHNEVGSPYSVRITEEDEALYNKKYCDVMTNS